jgi:parvulin-like peptidyl-prolyl isomerase
VDDERITQADLEDHLAVLVRQGKIRQEALSDPVRAKEVERVALDDLILRRLLLAEAERLKIAVEPGEEDMAFNKAHGAQFGESKLPEAAKKTGGDANRLRLEVRRQLLMTRLAEKITEGVTVSDDDLAQYYEGHRQAFGVPEMVRMRLLIVDSREEAERLRTQILNGADFAALARQHSKGGAKDRGGDMGWVDPRMLPAAIATGVLAIPRTGITPVIEAKGGFYVVRVEGRKAPRELSLAEAKDQIRKQLTAERKQAELAKWVQERRRSARIQTYL